MLGVTWAGHRLSGRITDRQGFFQAGGTMPWWAVSASIIATVVSAVTFVSVPAAVFAPGKSNLRSGRYRPSSGKGVGG